jgi:PEP-CTERM motif
MPASDTESLADLSIQVEGRTPADFSSLYVVLSFLPSATFNCTLFSNCGSFSDLFGEGGPFDLAAPSPGFSDTASVLLLQVNRLAPGMPLLNPAILDGLGPFPDEIHLGLYFELASNSGPGNPMRISTSFEPASVPEPGTLLLMSAGIASLVASRRRRAK